MELEKLFGFACIKDGDRGASPTFELLAMESVDAYLPQHTFEEVVDLLLCDLVMQVSHDDLHCEMESDGYNAKKRMNHPKLGVKRVNSKSIKDDPFIGSFSEME